MNTHKAHFYPAPPPKLEEFMYICSPLSICTEWVFSIISPIPRHPRVAHSALDALGVVLPQIHLTIGTPQFQSYITIDAEVSSLYPCMPAHNAPLSHALYANFEYFRYCQMPPSVGFKPVHHSASCDCLFRLVVCYPIPASPECPCSLLTITVSACWRSKAA